MFLRWLFAALHLLALGIGLGAIWGRRMALLGILDEKGLKRLFHEDTWWGVAAVLWIGTGFGRALGGPREGSLLFSPHRPLPRQKAGFPLLPPPHDPPVRPPAPRPR